MLAHLLLAASRPAHAVGPSSNWRWFVSALGVAMIGYGYYEHWRARERTQAFLLWVLALGLFVWAGGRYGFRTLAVIIVAWVVLFIGASVLSERLPKPHFTRAENRFVMELQPARRTGKRRLIRETQQLVAEMFEHIRAHPDSNYVEWQDMTMKMAGASEEEKHQIWVDHTNATIQRSDREAQENLQLFGGRLEDLLHEFERRHKSDPDRRSLLTGQLRSNHWLAELAAYLDSLWRKL